jgi:homoserine dehydrogenase
VRGIFGGETSFSGFGAGGSPTAVAVVSDVLSVCARPREAAVAASARVRAARADQGAPNPRATPLHDVSGDFVAPHYVRFTVSDKPGILAAVCAAYARYGINIEGVLQLPRFRKDRLPFVTTLEECPESVLDRALAEVSQSDYHVVPPLALPIFA